MLRIQALPPPEVPFALFTEAQRTRVLPVPREPTGMSPLREPELFRAWEESVWRELAQRIRGDIDGTIRKTYKDAELGRAMRPVWLHFCGAMADMYMGTRQEFESAMFRLARKYTTETNPDLSRLEKENPQLKQELDDLVKETWQKREEAQVVILRKTRQSLLKEANAYFDRLPEKITRRTP